MTNSALRRGGLRWVHTDADTLAFVRQDGDCAVLVSASRTANPAAADSIVASLAQAGLGDESGVDALSGSTLRRADLRDRLGERGATVVRLA